MAEISFDSIDTQELFTTGSLNNRFSAGAGSLQVAINDIEQNAVAPGALNENHLPSLALFRGTISQNAGTYTWGNSGYTGGTGYAAIDSNGETGGGTPFEIDLGSLYNLSTGQAQGVFVLVDVGIHFIKRAAGNYDDLDGVTIRVQGYNGAAWESINRSQRFLSAQIYQGAAESNNRSLYARIPVRTLIKAADMTGSGGGTASSISKVRVQIAVNSGDNSTDVTAALHTRNMTAIVLQSTVT
jgi:hypothetical protein